MNDNLMSHDVMLWRRLDQPGHDAARLIRLEDGYHLEGTAMFMEKGLPCRLDYLVLCDAEWHARSANISGWVGEENIALEIRSGADGRWYLNGTEVQEVRGCIDLDLSFSPATNLIAIRRLALAIGESGESHAAWILFPELRLAPLRQSYRRITPDCYHYESDGGTFVAELEVSSEGFVTSYGGLWVAEIAV